TITIVAVFTPHTAGEHLDRNEPKASASASTSTTSPRYRWRVVASALGIALDMQSIIDAAFNVGRKGSFWLRINERWLAWRYGWNLRPRYILDASRAKSFLMNLRQSVNRAPRDARVDYDGRKITILPGESGAKLDINTTLALWHRLLSDGHIDNLPVVVEESLPKVTTKDVAHIDAVLADFATRFNPRKRTRTHNIRIAARALDHVLIHPGEVFSYNACVGPRVPQRGYRIAPVFVRGQLSTDYGGGVCQVATTLFNAALLSGMEIVERHRHSRLVDYVPVGRDAAVVYGKLDLKFRNPYPTPVYLRTFVNSNRVRIVILGKSTGLRYVIKRQVLKVVPMPVITKSDPTLPAGKRVVK
ncbi:MAG TPA: hypothetical protein EYP10_04080, partial [Armatimonadetes bacterium]|nr:hypothetical protein [Armatimonadota bacterium]